MLTAFQVEVVAYSTPWGEFFCVECTHGRLEQDGGGGVEGFEPVIRYSLDEYQGERFAGEDPGEVWGNDDHTEECTPAVNCDACGGELAEEYHYGHEEFDEGPQAVLMAGEVDV